uniref:Uncharacterized protein n=1 Tax=Anguilla anguilla TaxID=7936 RepID=A0A0E9P9S9_ANGAN
MTTTRVCQQGTSSKRNAMCDVTDIFTLSSSRLIYFHVDK